MESSVTRSLGDAWIQTFTGRQFWPLEPLADDVCIEDIAHALSLKCRFAGHTTEFYSVAQHSVLASRACDEAPLWALLHDASEAYLPDVCRPIKKHLRGFKSLENQVMAAIAERFALTLPMPESIHDIDLVMLATEQRDLLCSPPAVWGSTKGVRMLDRIIPWSPAVAEREFWAEFNKLYKGAV